MSNYLLIPPQEYDWLEGFTFLFLGFIAFSIVTFGIGFVFSLIGYFYYSLSFRANTAREKRRLNKFHLSATKLTFLQINFPFYKQLPTQALKDSFAKKVALFSSIKTFVAQDTKEEVNSEMKTLIAAYAAQVTFGWPHIYLAHFRTIYVYPDVYFSKKGVNYHKGEVNTKGAIVFAWKELAQELDNASDGRNLGIHEMSHALYLENMIKNKEYNFIPKKYIYDLHAAFNNESQLDQTLLRDYAFNNVIEFFAVASEVFFEKGAILKAHKPELYDLLTHIYNQDPLQGNYPLKIFRGTSLGDYLEDIFGVKKWGQKFRKWLEQLNPSKKGSSRH
ncbi:hypothetical protein SAMN06298216_1921 [Spirosomataceae bacterium TFI 002]|nr:hypothetical protein SAMN06298216_1921 [Spirosomataceae bacterium TFI 002]